MKNTIDKKIRLLLVLLLAAWAAGASTQPPDSEYNHVYERIEIIDTVPVADSLEVRHTIDRGPGAPKEWSIISGHPADDVEARLTVDVQGDTWVVWTRQTEVSQVILRKRNGRGGWTSDSLVSEPGEHSYAPDPLHDGRSIWITYTIDDGESFGVAVRSGDGPVPWPVRSIIHTIYARELQPRPRLHQIDGELLMTWNESRYLLGYSFYDEKADRWGAPGFEDHDGDREEALRKIADQR